MKMRLLLVYAALSVCLSGFAQTLNLSNSVSPVMFLLNVIPGPEKSNASYDSWSKGVTAKMYDMHTNADLYAAIGDVGYRLQIPYICQPTDLSGTSVWVSLHVIARDPSYKFTLNQLSFKAWSTDQANSLGKTNSFADQYLVFTPTWFGVVWGQGGRGVADTIVDSGYCNQQGVNEAVLIGAMSSYFLYGQGASTLADITNYVMTSVNEFNLTFQWTLTDANGTWYGRRTLYKSADPFRASLTPVVVNNGSLVGFGVNAGTNDTWVVMSKNVATSIWQDTATVNAGDFLTQTLIPPAPQQGFYRLRRE